MRKLDSLQEILGVSFQNISHLELSLVHRSYLNEAVDPSLESNERLEFLGDACLGLVVAEKLYNDFPDFHEGELTKLRSALVRTDTLARVARSLNLGSYLYMGKGEEETGGRSKRRNLACTMEAVIGAVLVDKGFEAARGFVLRILSNEMVPAIEGKLEKDFKTRLQEIIQSKKQQPPTYLTIDSRGPDHEKVFTVEVLVGDTVLGRGAGKSKRGAEQQAAKAALEKLEGEEKLV